MEKCLWMSFQIFGWIKNRIHFEFSETFIDTVWEIKENRNHEPKI